MSASAQVCAVTHDEMLAAEQRAIGLGWTEEKLLETAGHALGHALGRFHQGTSGTAIGYLGKGHNAGDALAALAILRREYGWKIETRHAYPHSSWAPLTSAQWQKHGFADSLLERPSLSAVSHPLILLDGMLGTGMHGPLRDSLRVLAEEMEWLRSHAGARVMAVDFPSGYAGNSADSNSAVVADHTWMIGNAKAILLESAAVNHVGALHLVPVEVLKCSGSSMRAAICPQVVEWGKAPREFDFHKGMAGRVSLWVGSPEYAGAAVLAAHGALRGGAGLVTIFTSAAAGAVIASRCVPEVMVREMVGTKELLDFPHDALVIGCGHAKSDVKQLCDLLELLCKPCVLDAGALDALAMAQRDDLLGENVVITPHPGEFRRLAPDLTDMRRELAAQAFCKRARCTLLLKGSRTLVQQQSSTQWINTTGTPAMATGGHGDMLAGVIGAKLAQGLSPIEAAGLSAWLCGRSAEIAYQRGGHSESSLLPSDCLQWLGAAEQDWRCATR